MVSLNPTTYPDQNKIDKLHKEVDLNRKKLNKAENDLDKLVNDLLKGVLSEGAIKKKNDTLSREVTRLKDKLNRDEQRLSFLPSKEEIERQEKNLKMAFQDYYYSRERFDSMSFEELRALMFSIFDGEDDDGNLLGVYVKRINPIGKYPVRFEYYINACFFAGYLESAPDNEDDSETGGKQNGKKASTGSVKQKDKKEGRILASSLAVDGVVRCGFLDDIENSNYLPILKSYKTKTRSLYYRDNCV